MENISLLPQEYKVQRQLRRRRKFYLSFGAVVLLVFIATYVILFSFTLTANLTLNNLQAQRMELEQKEAGLQEYAAMQAQVQELEALVIEALGTPPQWEAVLAGIGVQKPPGAWLTELTAAYDENGGEMVIRGLAFDNRQVASLLEELKQVNGLDGARVIFVTETMVEGSFLVQYEIKAKLLPAEPYTLEGGGV